MLSTLVFAAVAAPSLAQHRRHRSGPPKWLDSQISHRDIGHEIQAYDARTGFMLIGSAGCDGAYLDSTLTADRYEVAKMGFHVPDFEPSYGVENGDTEMELRELELVTEKGVHIGDTESKLIAKLGRPKKIKVDGWRKQFRVFTYTWHEDNRERLEDGTVLNYGRTYRQEYTFKQNKLVEISYGSESDEHG